MRTLVWLAVCCSFTGFYVLHVIIRNVLWKFSKLSYGQCYCVTTSVISALQSLIVSILSGRAFLLCQDIMHDGDEILEIYILISSAYLLYDLYAMYEGFVLRLRETEEKVAESSTVVLFMKKHTFLVIHHVIAECYGLPVVTTWRGGLGLFFIAGFFLAEISTPFHNIRGILLVVGIKSGLFYNVNGILFMITFFLARVCMVPYLYYRYAVYKGISFLSVPSSIPLHCNIASAAFLLLQVYWFTLIMNHFSTKLLQLLQPRKAVDSSKND
ncbi:TLC domain-containing protein 3A-like [Clytia hemisphaerica]|uniref:TLC domain-containing protein n=1 Tax=Clytia hemisphaerica TaxID=252671 RepID=A0A7M5X8E3_9CNID|eukprot:TCONS_00032748-protein